MSKKSNGETGADPIALNDYEVGYGKPPKSHQFKPGQSGNPKGGKKPTKSVEELFFHEASKLVSLKEGGQATTVSKREALIKAIFAKALQGDLKAAALVLSQIGQADAKFLAAAAQKLSDAEFSVLKDLFGEAYENGGGNA